MNRFLKIGSLVAAAMGAVVSANAQTPVMLYWQNTSYTVAAGSTVTLSLYAQSQTGSTFSNLGYDAIFGIDTNLVSTQVGNNQPNTTLANIYGGPPAARTFYTYAPSTQWEEVSDFDFTNIPDVQIPTTGLHLFDVTLQTSLTPGVSHVSLYPDSSTSGISGWLAQSFIFSLSPPSFTPDLGPNVTITTTPVPEPTTLVGAGLGVLALIRRRRAARAK